MPPRPPAPNDPADRDEDLPHADAQRRALDAAITTSLHQAAHGHMSPAARVLEQLRARRR